MKVGLSLVLLLALAGCDRPSEEDCRKAVTNIEKITHQEVDVERAVRSCRSRSSRSAVSCWIAAQTPEDMAKCEGPPTKKDEAAPPTAPTEPAPGTPAPAEPPPKTP